MQMRRLWPTVMLPVLMFIAALCPGAVWAHGMGALPVGWGFFALLIASVALPGLVCITVLAQYKWPHELLKSWNLLGLLISPILAFFFIPFLKQLVGIPIGCWVVALVLFLLRGKEAFPSSVSLATLGKTLGVGALGFVLFSVAGGLWSQHRQKAFHANIGVLKDQKTPATKRQKVLDYLLFLGFRRFDGVHLEGLDIPKLLAKKVVLIDVSLAKVDLSGLKLEGEFHGVDFSKATLKNADLSKATLQSPNFTGANLQGAKLPKGLFSPNFTRADLRGVELHRMHLHAAKLARTDLRGAKLPKKHLNRARLEYAKLQKLDLTGADMFGTRAQHADFTGADLRRASLNSGQLQGANFTKASLSHADLAHADLRGAIFRDVSLDYACFRKSKLQKARFQRVAVKGAMFYARHLPLLQKAGVDLGGKICLSVHKSHKQNLALRCYIWHHEKKKQPPPPHCPKSLKGPIIGFPKLAKEGECPG